MKMGTVCSHLCKKGEGKYLCICLCIKYSQKEQKALIMLVATREGNWAAGDGMSGRLFIIQRSFGTFWIFNQIYLEFKGNPYQNLNLCEWELMLILKVMWKCQWLRQSWRIIGGEAFSLLDMISMVIHSV